MANLFEQNALWGANGDPHMRPIFGESITLDNSWKYCKLYDNIDEKIVVIGRCNILPNHVVKSLHRIDDKNNIINLKSSDTYVFAYFDCIYLFKNKLMTAVIDTISSKILLGTDVVKSFRSSNGLYSFTHNKYYASKNVKKYYMQLTKLCKLIIVIDNFWDDVNHIYLSDSNNIDLESMSGELIIHNNNNNIIDPELTSQINYKKFIGSSTLQKRSCIIKNKSTVIAR